MHSHPLRTVGAIRTERADNKRPEKKPVDAVASAGFSGDQRSGAIGSSEGPD